MSSLRPDTRLIAIIVASAFFMQLLDSAIINTSLPQMAKSFHVQPLDLSIGITIYMMSAAAFVPLSGWLADRCGARNVFMWAIGIFTLSSLACGLGTNLVQFSVARALQGLGGALMTPVGRIVVLRHTERSNLLQATALITWPALTAPVVAPVLGGFITTYASWRWNFLLNIPLGIAGIALVARFVPNLRDEQPTRLDWRGFFLSAMTLLALLYGLEAFAHASSQWLTPAVLVLAGLVLGAFTVRHFERVKHPLLELSAVRIQTFALSNVTAGAVLRTAINCTPFLLPLLFQVGFGLSALSSGTLVLVYFAANLGIKPLTSPTLRRFGFRSVSVVNGLAAGFAIMTCAFFSRDTPHWLVMAVLLLAGLTRSMQMTCLNTLTFADITASQRSSAATLSSILQQVVMVLGVAYGAFLLNTSQLMHHNTTVGVIDFHVAFAVVGLTAVAAALFFLKLPLHAGTEVSGHQPSGSRHS